MLRIVRWGGRPIKYPVRLDYPGGVQDVRDLFDLRDIELQMDGGTFRPALTVDFDPFTIRDAEEHVRVVHEIRARFRCGYATRGVSIPGAQVLDAEPSCVPEWLAFGSFVAFWFFWIGILTGRNWR